MGPDGATPSRILSRHRSADLASRGLVHVFLAEAGKVVSSRTCEYRSRGEFKVRTSDLGTSRAVLEAVSPEPDETFDPAAFRSEPSTLYLLATGAGASGSWPMAAAFVEDLTEVVRHRAAASIGARLDPPMLLAIDEIGDLAPLPSLVVLMAGGGGTGITTTPVLQSLAQAQQVG